MKKLMMLILISSVFAMQAHASGDDHDCVLKNLRNFKTLAPDNSAYFPAGSVDQTQHDAVTVGN